MPKIYFFKKYNMANKEVVTVLTVKTEQSQNTIKGLKQEIADLKKKLDTAVIGTDEFEQASKELATAQANLKTVLADGKKTTDAVEGSYNHLTATMAELKKQWKATADEVKRNELGQQIDTINSKLKDMDASTGNFQRNVGDYANKFKEAFEEQQKSSENVRLGLDGLQKTAAGLASGYAAVQGAMNLLNIENSDFEKAMIKVQSAMAIAQGIGGMKDLIEGAGTLKVVLKGATTGVKTFITGLSGVKKAIAATGIGLLVVALGTLVAYWDDVTAAVKRWTGAMDDGAEKVDEILSKQGKLSSNAVRMQKELNRELAIMKAEGKTDLEIAQKKLELSEQIYNEQKAYVDSLEKQYNHSKWQKDQGVPLSDFTKEVLERYPEMIEKGKELTESYRQNWLDARNEIKVINITTDKEEAEERLRIAKETADKKAQADAEADAKAQADKEAADAKAEADAKASEQKRIADQEHNIDRWAELERRKLDKQQQVRDEWAAENEVDLDGNSDGWYTQEELDNYQTFLNTKQQMYAEAIAAENLLIESQIKKLQELADAQAAAGMDNTGTLESIEDLKLQLEDNNAAILKNEKDTLKAKEKANKEYEENEKKRKKLVAEYSLNIASNTLGSLSQIIGEETAVGKAAAVAQATIDTYQAANASYQAMAGIPVVGPALGAAAAAAAVVAGIANVKKILSVDKNGSGAVDTGTGAAATPNVNLAESLPIQYSRELLTDSETTNLNKEQRVYVLESDITDTQNDVKVKENNSSF